MAKKPRSPKKKVGQALEEHVAWIEQGLDETAEVKRGEDLLDHESEDTRNCDVTVRTRDGDDVRLKIVEVRDRNRKVDVEYVGATADKMSSVGAQKAQIVSKAGFTAPAVKKARKKGMAPVSYQEAPEEGAWIRDAVAFYCDLKVTFGYAMLFPMGSDHRAVPHPDLQPGWNEDLRLPVLENDEGRLFLSIYDLIQNLDVLWREQWPQFKDTIPLDGSELERVGCFDLSLMPALWLRDDQGARVRIQRVVVGLKYHYEAVEMGKAVRDYKDEAEGRIHGQIATVSAPINDNEAVEIDVLHRGAPSDVTPIHKTRISRVPRKKAPAR